MLTTAYRLCSTAAICIAVEFQEIFPNGASPSYAQRVRMTHSKTRAYPIRVRRKEIDMSQDHGGFNPLNEEETHVIINKGTERAFTGEYTEWKFEGTFICRRCNAALYHSDHKFDSGCGWPSFDDELPESVTRIVDADGRRTEIVCTNCDGHLGHVFLGEGATAKNTRHCVNSLSIRFVEKDIDHPTVIRPEQ
jgi:peptide-methionine (R)-S-oxide reductase